MNSTQFQPGQRNKHVPTTAMSTVENGSVRPVGRNIVQFGGPTNIYLFERPGQYSLMMPGYFAGNRSGLPSGSFTGTTAGAVQSASVGVMTSSTSPVGPKQSFHSPPRSFPVVPEQSFQSPPQGRVSPFLPTGRFKPTYS